MAKNSQEMKSWQVFHFARKRLGRSILYGIFGKKNPRTVDYWCEDPKYTGKNTEAFDPIQGVRDLFSILDDHGHTEVVRAAVSYMVSGTSIECGHSQEFAEPLPTLHEEILADYRAVAALQSAIEAGESIACITDRKRAAIAEIERTVAKYMEVNG